MHEIEGGSDLCGPAERPGALAELVRELLAAEKKRPSGLRTLDSFSIGTGLLILEPVFLAVLAWHLAANAERTQVWP